ncbi:MAG: hypothetical protein Q9200_004813 [Gallowayella weberi]
MVPSRILLSVNALFIFASTALAVGTDCFVPNGTDRNKKSDVSPDSIAYVPCNQKDPFSMCCRYGNDDCLPNGLCRGRYGTKPFWRESSTPLPGQAGGTPAPTPKPDDGGTNTGAIAGGVVGGVVALALIGAAIWFFRRRGRQQHQPELADAPPKAPAPRYHVHPGLHEAEGGWDGITGKGMSEVDSQARYEIGDQRRYEIGDPKKDMKDMTARQELE